MYFVPLAALYAVPDVAAATVSRVMSLPVF
jgi:hypothetical protein